jgi:hypothetical protein
MQERRPPSPQDVGMILLSIGDGILTHLPWVCRPNRTNLIFKCTGKTHLGRNSWNMYIREQVTESLIFEDNGKDLNPEHTCGDGLVTRNSTCKAGQEESMDVIRGAFVVWFGEDEGVTI